MILAANTIWYVARAGGILAYVLLTGSVVLGLLLSGRARLPGWPRFALEDVHRFVGLLAGTFIVIHVGALLFDSYLPFSLTNLVIPGTAPYRPLSVALGIVAAELLAALALTNHYRKAFPTGSGGGRTTSTSRSGCSRSRTGSRPGPTGGRPGPSRSTSARRRSSPG